MSLENPMAEITASIVRMAGIFIILAITITIVSKHFLVN